MIPVYPDVCVYVSDAGLTMDLFQRTKMANRKHASRRTRVQQQQQQQQMQLPLRMQQEQQKQKQKQEQQQKQKQQPLHCHDDSCPGNRNSNTYSYTAIAIEKQQWAVRDCGKSGWNRHSHNQPPAHPNPTLLVLDSPPMWY